jgi:hypothetical protein
MYGQLNELRESILTKVTENQDLLKLIYYCDVSDTEDILSLSDLSKTEIKSLYNTQIFKYKRMPINNQTKSKCFLSMQFGRVIRDTKNNRWMIPLFAFTIICADGILENTITGNRILAIEQCLTDIFSYQNIDSSGMTYVVGSEPEQVDTGFQGRTITIKFFDYVS